MWKKISFVLVALIMLSMAGGGFWGWTTWQALEIMQKRSQTLETFTNELKILADGLKNESSAKETARVDLETELRVSKIQWESERNLLKSQLESKNSQLESKQAEVVSLKAKQTELLQEQADLAKEYNRKIEENYKKGQEEGRAEVLKSGILLKKPTYQELVDLWFVVPDVKVIKPFIPGKLVCVDLAAAFNNAAVKDGFQVGTVFLVFGYTNEGAKVGHFINVLKTEDGMIYVEPQNHKVVQIEIGKSYSRLNGFDLDPDDIIREVIIFW